MFWTEEDMKWLEGTDLISKQLFVSEHRSLLPYNRQSRQGLCRRNVQDQDYAITRGTLCFDFVNVLR